MKKDERQLIAALERAERTSVSGDELEQERSLAIEYYNGDMRDMPVEIEGRSRFVSRDVADTIHWIMPSLMRIFTSGDEVVLFDPTGPEDVDAATQETEYINDIVTNRNNSFVLFHTWFHDALLEKAGYAYAYYDETEEVSEEEYEGQTLDSLTLLLQDPEVELIEQEEVFVGAEPMFNVKIRRTCKEGQVCVQAIPPSDVRVADGHNSILLDDAPFVQYNCEKPISDLRQMGFDVPDDINDGMDEDSQSEDLKDYYADGGYDDDDEEADPSMRVVTLKTAFIRTDYDGDGIAELRKVVRVGKTIFENEVAEFIPIAPLTPMLRSHQHTGMSVADMVMDIQRLKTAMIRGVIDNVALANNGRHAINAERVNLDDMLVSRPGGVVRVDGDPMGAIMPLQHPLAAPAILGVIEYADTIKENRTGVTRYNQGIDANSLNKTATGISQIMGAAQQRIDLIARTFAETGVKYLFQVVHALSLKHVRKPQIVRLRNNWIAVDPSQWKKRTDMTVSVGLGSGSKESQQQSLMMILQAQKEALQIGIATPQNIYHALTKLTQLAGHKDVDKFWTDPSTVEPQPPKPDPVIEKAKIDSETKLKQTQMQEEGDTRRTAMQIEGEKNKDLMGMAYEAGQTYGANQVLGGPY